MSRSGSSEASGGKSGSESTFKNVDRDVRYWPISAGRPEAVARLELARERGGANAGPTRARRTRRNFLIWLFPHLCWRRRGQECFFTSARRNSQKTRDFSSSRHRPPLSATSSSQRLEHHSYRANSKSARRSIAAATCRPGTSPRMSSSHLSPGADSGPRV